MAHDVTWQSHNRAASMAEMYEQRRFYLAFKRLFDIVVAAILLLVLAPLMLLVALVIVLETPGPFIYGQQRVGLKRRRVGRKVAWTVGTFTFYKFRTMYHNSDTAPHREFVRAYIRNDRQTMAELQGGDAKILKLQRDRRVTRSGWFLRRTSLDELPQLWNVLMGSMSLVGPRPPIPYELEWYEAWHHQRLEAKPGITGLWQVTARSSVSFDEMVKLDIQYVECQSVRLDLKILAKTPLAALRGHGAV